jgi:hypothetical protein
MIIIIIIKMSLNKPIWKLRDWIDIKKIDWYELSLNPNAIELLKENQDKIYWNILSANPNAIELLEANQDKINWYILSANPNAIELLEANQDKINWFRLFKNRAIFELDYEAMKIANQLIYEELLKEVMKPSRVFKNPDYDYIEQLFGD